MRLLSTEEANACASRLSRESTAGVRDDLLDDPECGFPLRVYVAITCGKIGNEFNDLDRLYNRYYWFQRFASVYQFKYGPDAGIEQQAIQILEQSSCDVDWSILARINQLANRLNG